jgi:invasion protein IalB
LKPCCSAPEASWPLYEIDNVVWRAISRSKPASISAVSRAIGVPATAKGVPPTNACCAIGVTSPKACCQPSVPRQVANVDPNRNGAAARMSALLGWSAPAFGQAANPAAGSLPGGATAISERYGDWGVNCTQQENAKSCVIAYQQVESRSGQRLLAIELGPRGADKAEGTIAVPFGLLFEPGITQIGEGPPCPAFRFRTCSANGCVVAVAFDAKVLDTIRKNSALKINGTAADANKPVSFTVSLKGFARPSRAR